MLLEFAGGIWSNSLALLADAGHMLADTAAIGLALFAAWFAAHPPSKQKTYGYYRLEILAAFLNGIVLVLVSLYIFWEAVHRFSHPEQVQGNVVLGIATVGLIANLVSAGLLYRSGQHNLNVRGAFLHVISDSLGSVGAIIAGICVMYFGFRMADPIISMFIACLVLYNAWRLIEEATNVLLEGCPVHLDVADIKAALIDLHEIRAVHDLHVWSITLGKEAMSVHIVVDEVAHYRPELVGKIQQVLKEKFGLTHITVQLETPDFIEEDIHD